MEQNLDIFINPWAGRYRNRWYWDSLLNRLEGISWFPDSLSRKLRGIRREEDFLFERAHRQADRYARIVRNDGRCYVTTSIDEFQHRFAHALRERPDQPKIICSGDGGIKEALTTAICYIEQHNALEARVTQAFEDAIQDGEQNLNEQLRQFLAALPFSPWEKTPPLSPLAKLLLLEKRVDFDLLAGKLTLTADEQKFIAQHHVTLYSLLRGPLPLPVLGIIPGGTFNVVAHHLGIKNEAVYLETTVQQMQRGEEHYSFLQPLRIEYQTTGGNNKVLYGNIYGHGAIRDFFELYYGKGLRPGPLKALYLTVGARYVKSGKFAAAMEQGQYHYQLTFQDGSVEEKSEKNRLAIISGINRLPFNISFFHPEPGCMHAALTSHSLNRIMLKAAWSSYGIGQKLHLADPAEIEGDYPSLSKVVISVPPGKNVKFIVDGDLSREQGDQQEYYDSPTVSISMGPELKILTPT